MKECSAAQYLEGGYMVAALPQMKIALRAEDYASAAILWVKFEDPYRVRDLARMAATLAFLAFPDLRPAEAKHIPQAEIVIEPPTPLREIGMSKQRFVLDGTWRGYTSRQDHVCHREICSESKAAWANDTYCIYFTDGTTLELHARPAKPREKVELKPGYKSLIEDCFYKGVNSVAELCDLKKARTAEASSVAHSI